MTLSLVVIVAKWMLPRPLVEVPEAKNGSIFWNVVPVVVPRWEESAIAIL
jgi:hypothetical protein